MSNVTNNLVTPPSTDHDMLIRLDNKFDIFLNQYTIDIKRLENGTMAKIAAVEVVQRAQEVYLDEIKRIINVTEPERTVREFHEFKEKFNLIVATASIIGGLVMFILTQAPTILKNWGVL